MTADKATADSAIRDIRHAATGESIGQLPRIASGFSLRSLDTRLVDSVFDRHRSISISTLGRPPVVDRLLSRPPLGVLGAAAPGRLGTAVRLLHHRQETTDTTRPPAETGSEPIAPYAVPVRSLLDNQPVRRAITTAVDTSRVASAVPTPEPVDDGTEIPSTSEADESTPASARTAREKDPGQRTHTIHPNSSTNSLLDDSESPPPDDDTISPPDDDTILPPENGEPSTDQREPPTNQRTTVDFVHPELSQGESAHMSATETPRRSIATLSPEAASTVDPSVAVLQQSTAQPEQHHSSPGPTAQSTSIDLPSLAHFTIGRQVSHPLGGPLQSPTSSTPPTLTTGRPSAKSSPPTTASRPSVESSPPTTASQPSAKSSPPTTASQPFVESSPPTTAGRPSAKSPSTPATPQPIRMGETGARLSYLTTARTPPTVERQPEQSRHSTTGQPRTRSGRTHTLATPAATGQYSADSSTPSPATRSDSIPTPTPVVVDLPPEPRDSESPTIEYIEQPPPSVEHQSPRRHQSNPTTTATAADTISDQSTVDSDSRPAPPASRGSSARQEPLPTQDPHTGPRPRASPIFATNRIAAHGISQPSVWEPVRPSSGPSGHRSRYLDIDRPTTSAVSHAPVAPSAGSPPVSDPGPAADYSVLGGDRQPSADAVRSDRVSRPAVARSSSGSPPHPVDARPTAGTDAPTVRRQPSAAPPEPFRPEPMALLPTVRSTLAAAEPQAISYALAATTAAVPSPQSATPTAVQWFGTEPSQKTTFSQPIVREAMSPTASPTADPPTPSTRAPDAPPRRSHPSGADARAVSTASEQSTPEPTAGQLSPPTKPVSSSSTDPTVSPTASLDSETQPTASSHQLSRRRQSDSSGAGVGSRPAADSRRSTDGPESNRSALGRLATQLSAVRSVEPTISASPLRATHVPPTMVVDATARTSPAATRWPSLHTPPQPTAFGRLQPTGGDRTQPATNQLGTQRTSLSTPNRTPAADPQVSTSGITGVSPVSASQPDRSQSHAGPADGFDQVQPSAPLTASVATPEAAGDSPELPTAAAATTQPSVAGRVGSLLASPIQPQSSHRSSLVPLGSAVAHQPLGSFRPPLHGDASSHRAESSRNVGSITVPLQSTPSAEPAEPSAQSRPRGLRTESPTLPELQEPTEPSVLSASPALSESAADPLSDVPSLVHQESLASGGADTAPSASEDGPSVAQLAAAVRTHSHTSSTPDTSQVATDRQHNSQSGPSGFRWRSESSQSLSHPRSRYEPQEPTTPQQDSIEHPRAGRQQSTDRESPQPQDETPTSPFSSTESNVGQPQSTSRPSTAARSRVSTPDPSTLAETLQSGARTDELVGQLYREMERKQRIERQRRGL